ncbi:MAG: type II toxin-antitoxin system VapC family toxin [Actinobacteria bacterium]|nr:type II toxin-antitoxin system VapC family toxin [Actinomycetota bacterium]
MSFVVLDTDVASAILRQRVPESLARSLVGRSLAVTFVTVGELWKWTLVRQWGAQRAAGMQAFLSRVVVLPYSAPVARTWGELQAHAQRRGRPRPANDTWIAACCLVRELPLATLNLKDFSDFAEHEGLVLIS